MNIKLSPAARAVLYEAHDRGHNLVVSAATPDGFKRLVPALLAADLWLENVLEIVDNVRGPAGEVVVFRLTWEGRELVRVMCAS